eukprot:TRINITY_DN188_c0_g1_i2.p1 TRINITY_DN188_c0_g1~~TRINITY_DN188_c0_g1_i2.p1  ORF type:complete len:487 (+),score=64.81 TRINITY_DN188_c0_g1_i2:436-1896(+)
MILQQISTLQLLHLTHNTLPPGSQETKTAFLLKVQEAFQSWSPETLRQYHSTLSETPLHLERQQLLQLEPNIPWEILHLLIELLKLPIDELFSFQAWISALPQAHMHILIYLLQIESATLLAIKQKIATSPNISLTSSGSRIPNFQNGLTQQPAVQTKKRKAEDDLHLTLSIEEELEQIGSSGGFSLEMEGLDLNKSSGNLSPLSSSDMMLDDTPVDFEPPSPSPSQNGMNTTSFTSQLFPNTTYKAISPSPEAVPSKAIVAALPPQPKFKIRIARQPPAKTVYQRILKPFPSIMLESGHDAESNLFIEAELLRSDTDAELHQCLDGVKIVRISDGTFACFKRLKILSTSQQQGTLFRLRFTLKRYQGTSFEGVDGCSIISNPIEVFSHTQYLNDKQDAPPPPVVTEVLPSTGGCAGGTRIVILGSNFINNPKLKVRFGDVVVPATFHEGGTLIVVTPPRTRSRVPVSVTNDDVNFCETSCFFSFE